MAVSGGLCDVVVWIGLSLESSQKKESKKDSNIGFSLPLYILMTGSQTPTRSVLCLGLGKVVKWHLIKRHVVLTKAWFGKRCYFAARRQYMGESIFPNDGLAASTSLFQSFSPNDFALRAKRLWQWQCGVGLVRRLRSFLLNMNIFNPKSIKTRRLTEWSWLQIDRHRILDTMPSGKVGDRGSSAGGRAGQDCLLILRFCR